MVNFSLPLSLQLIQHTSVVNPALMIFVFVSDLLHTFSSLPRDLNFIDHTSNIGWKE